MRCLKKLNSFYKVNIKARETIISKKAQPKYVKDVISLTNIRFFRCMRIINQLDRKRALQVLTLLLNNSICSLYFPTFESTINVLREKGYQTSEDLIEKEHMTEIIYGLSLYIILKYKSNRTQNPVKTDILIDTVRETFIPFFIDFFQLNFLPMDFKISEITKYIEYFRFEYKFLPDLDFDPKFQIVIDSEPIKYLYQILNITNISEQRFDSKYLPNRDLWENISREMLNPVQTPLGINPRLSIALDAKMFNKAYGTIFFGSKELIDNIIDQFIDYFCDRFILQEDVIHDTLLCFGTLLKATEGSGQTEILFNKVKEMMMLEVEEKFAVNFLDKFIGKKQFEIMESDWNRINYKMLIRDYQDFVKYAGYSSLGKIYTGSFLVWRSLLKYLETIQQDLEFKSLKGALLESWAYNEAINLKFSAEKLILVNKTKKNPTDNYKKMKEQIKTFPKKPLELRIDFPETYSSFYFQEFDLAIRVENYLFVIECKGTSVPKSEWPKVVFWVKRLQEEHFIMSKKVSLLEILLGNSTIKHPFLEGVVKVVQCHLKTEGVLEKVGTFTMKMYSEYFKILRDYLDRDEFTEFIQKYLLTFEDEEN